MGRPRVSPRDTEKMQNELRATADGIITKITAIEGATVETGAALMTLGPKAGQ